MCTSGFAVHKVNGVSFTWKCFQKIINPPQDSALAADGVLTVVLQTVKEPHQVGIFQWLSC